MKVLDLRCGNGHRFEGWFGSEPDFLSQSENRLVTCPVCSDAAVVRVPSAPRLNISGQSQPPGAAPAASASANANANATVDVDAGHKAQAGWLRAMREVLKNTEDVGDRFPEEARRIHHKETAERAIRGRASKEEAQALRDEGIEVSTVVLPESLKGSVH